MRRAFVLVVLASLGAACGPAAKPAVAPAPVAKTEPVVDVAAARGRHQERGFAWNDWSEASFAKAKNEHKMVLLHGAAPWCHWCHVMEETTYKDPQVAAVINAKFVPIRVDIDAHPEIADRYAEWGWPATIVLTADGADVGKYRGYLPTDKFLELLAAAASPEKSGAPSKERSDLPADIAALPWVAASIGVDLDRLYDDDEGGFGVRQKAAIGSAVEVLLRRAAHGDAEALARAQFTLAKQRALLDPVWGGVYQYSAATDWNSPHFEKLMTFQAANLEAYARGYEATKDETILADAKAIATYLETFLSRSDGAFYTNQDADVGAHDDAAPFVDGHAYYPLSDSERRQKGVPWVDTHVYARENGLAISAFVALYDVTKDAAYLARAARALDVVAASHEGGKSRVVHDAEHASDAPVLVDAAAFGRAAALVAARTKKDAHLALAKRIADGLAAFEDKSANASGGLFDSAPDAAANGVFARRSKPILANALAARFLAALGAATGDPAYPLRAKKLLAAIATPKGVVEEGRFVGEIWLALDDAGATAWR